jgi:glyoxylase I family protein
MDRELGAEALGELGEGMQIRGVRHVALTVGDLARSVSWYCDVLGFIEQFRESSPERTAAILTIPGQPVLIGLVQFAARTSEGFDPRSVGLDHLCLLVDSRSELEGWTDRLEGHSVEHSGVREMATGAIVNFKDPDGIALALSIPPSVPEPAHQQIHGDRTHD